MRFTRAAKERIPAGKMPGRQRGGGFSSCSFVSFVVSEILVSLWLI
jgi:hypothetical protein